jgi:hypothetical protein
MELYQCEESRVNVVLPGARSGPLLGNAERRRVAQQPGVDGHVLQDIVRSAGLIRYGSASISRSPIVIARVSRRLSASHEAD